MSVFFQDQSGFRRELIKFFKSGVGGVHPPQGQGRVHILQLPIVGNAVKKISFLGYIKSGVKPFGQRIQSRAPEGAR